MDVQGLPGDGGAEVTNELIEQEQDTRAEVVASLKRIRDLKAYKKELEEELSALELRLKSVLEEDREPIIDGEHGLVATLQERRKPAEIDFITFAERPDAGRLLSEAAGQGLISARLTQIRGLKGKSEAADALLSAEMPGGVNHILVIEEA